MSLLSRAEAQTLIYRGCARLAAAMKVQDVPQDQEEKWEKEAIREAVRATVVLRAKSVVLTRLWSLDTHIRRKTLSAHCSRALWRTSLFRLCHSRYSRCRNTSTDSGQ